MTDTNNVQVTSNPATQTLFRFVSLRNPQLAESKNNIGFITRPKIGSLFKGDFDKAIEAWEANNPKTTTKFHELEVAAAGFEDKAFKREKEIEALVPAYYQLGKSLSRNEDIDFDKSYSKIIESDLSKLWDNLIYQVVTQKDFYIKEAIIQTLKAVHYTENNSDEATAGQAKKAKVVLPAKLFVEEAPVEDEEEDEERLFTVDRTVIGSEDHIAGGNNAARILEPVQTRSLSVMQESKLRVNAEKSVQVTNALLKKEMIQSLKKELEVLQKSYNKSYNKAYNTAYSDYLAIAQPIIDANNVLLDDLETTFDENTTEAAKKTAYDQLELEEVPRFEFKYKNEINFTDLRAKLTSESFNLFLDLFTEYDADAISENIETGVERDLEIISDTEINIYATTVTLAEDYSSYQDIFTKINEDISTQSKAVLSAVEMPKQQYVNLGGALVPVAKASAVAPLSYLLQATYFTVSWFVNINYLQFSFEVENDSWSVAKARITGNTSTGNALEQIHLQIPVVDSKITLPLTFQNKFKNLSNLKIEIYFDNGREALLELTEIVNNAPYTGILPLKSLNGNASGGGMTPKYFGVKRLGIADYLKVEQSVHAYVPGEVSNIENVMASELRHKSSVARDYSEITDTTSKSQETEKISDTTKATRTDMQTEVAKEIDKQQSIGAHTSFSAGGAKWKLEVGGSYANSTAQHDSTRQAVAKSQELTERAMERVLTKVAEERVQKIIKEYTETNVHEFDNRGKATVAGTQAAIPQHITGVYRWVDKKMKNQIYNYGKRTMFEFMIPEPARLHRLALKSGKNVLTAPLDPRAEGTWQMNDYNVDESIIEHWAKIYNVEYSPSLPLQTTKLDNRHCTQDESNDEKFDVPENYVCKHINIVYRYEEEKKSGFLRFDTFDGNTITLYDHNGTLDFGNLNFSPEFHLRFYQNWLYYSNLAVTQYCDLSNEYITSRQKDYFKKIMDAYNLAYEKFQEAQAAADEAAIKDEAANKEKISNYYRDMEAEVLKHNCIAYLLQNNELKFGQALTEDKGTMQSFKVRFGDSLDAYTSLAKFMEQAMEWSIMDYTFYPYYWADSNNWQEMYLSSDLDPLFRNFLQAGMARVIVTVKPGFEDAVNFFMTTGRIWNGGEVPVIGDPMYLSIVEELREPTGKPQGNYWITRVPTALTILQARSVGLEVTDALPIFPEKDNGANCENPLELEYKSAFKPVDAVMQHGNEGSTLN